AGGRLGRRAFVARGGALGAGIAGVALVGCGSSNNNKGAATTAPTAASAAASAAATRAAATSAPASATGAAARTATPVAAAGGIANTSYGKPDPKFQAHDMPKTRGGTWRLFSY